MQELKEKMMLAVSAITYAQDAKKFLSHYNDTATASLIREAEENAALAVIEVKKEIDKHEPVTELENQHPF